MSAHGNDRRIGRRRFLKLTGAAAIAGLTGLVGHRVLIPRRWRRQTPTGYASAADVSVAFDSDAAFDTFSSIRHRDNLQIVDDPAETGKALEVRIPEGSHNGSALSYIFSDEGESEPEELWAQYDVYFPTDLEINGNGKLPGFGGTYGEAGWGGRPSDGTNGWSARGRFGQGDSPETTKVGYYVYHAEMDGTYGDHFEIGDVAWGEWHRIGQHIKLNTPGENDGVLEGWIDGEKKLSKQDIKFRNAGYDNLKIRRYWFNVYWGGSWTAPKDNAFYFDNFALSRDGFAGMGSATGDTTASSEGQAGQQGENPC